MTPNPEISDSELIAVRKAVSKEPLLDVDSNLQVQQLKTLPIEDLDRISRERISPQLPKEIILEATLELNRRLRK